MTNPSSKKSQKGTLALLGLLFLLSGAFRLATEAGQAFAKGEEEERTLTEIVEAETRPLDREHPARPELLTNALEAIRDREARLIEREKEIAKREKSVKAAEETIRTELEKLKTAEKNLRKTITLASEASENDLAQLTSMYSNMKPKQAAALFEQMDASFAAGFLYRMPPDSAARVMAGMTPEKAYQISVELAGRNADIPLE